MEITVLLLVCAVLMLCVMFNVSIIYALSVGLLIFCAYAKLKKASWAQLLDMIVSGVKAAKNILITFVLIGMLTALWRASGTIPVIICYAVKLIRPEVFILMTFLLNCGISVLTGTALGAAATMGVICMTMAVTMHIDPVFVGGAILSGVYFGDRCSPLSTSALLVCELTKTNIFDNVKRMLRTSLVPFVMACTVYTVMGLLSTSTEETLDLYLLFGRAFQLHWVALLPAVVILVLSGLRVNVKLAMSASIAAACLICYFIQHIGPADILRMMIVGYSASDPEVAAMLNGGGVLSMLKVAVVVCLSSAYSGIFQKTGLLDPLKEGIAKLSDRITSYGGTLCIAIVTAIVTCSQTLTIMLTHQLCGDLEPDIQKFAIDLEDTAAVIPPLIPWSIAGAVPLASASAPTASLWAACFLYLLPLWGFLVNLISKKRRLQVKPNLV